MEEFQNYIRANYYTVALMIASEIIAIYVSIRRWNDQPLLRVFIIYAIAGFLQDTSSIYLNYFSGLEKDVAFRIIYIMILVFVVIELSVYYSFFMKILRSHRVRDVLRILFLVFVILAVLSLLLYLFSIIRLNDYISFIFSILAFFLIYPCIIFFKSLFSHAYHINVNRQPEFWITVGIFFSSCCALPYNLLYRYIKFNYGTIAISSLESLIYVLYSIIFISITIAFLCKKPIMIY